MPFSQSCRFIIFAESDSRPRCSWIFLRSRSGVGRFAEWILVRMPGGAREIHPKRSTWEVEGRFSKLGPKMIGVLLTFLKKYHTWKSPAWSLTSWQNRPKLATPSLSIRGTSQKVAQNTSALFLFSPANSACQIGRHVRSVFRLFCCL